MTYTKDKKISVYSIILEILEKRKFLGSDSYNFKILLGKFEQYIKDPIVNQYI